MFPALGMGVAGESTVTMMEKVTRLNYHETQPGIDLAKGGE
jgi:hypothetical protein